MQISLGLKTPALSTIVVLGLGIGAMLNKDVCIAAFAFVVFALDVVRIKPAVQAAKQGDTPK